jgi:hypothetical protein
MKATIVSPSVEEGTQIGIGVQIPFETLKVSIAFDNLITLEPNTKWCTNQDIMVIDKKTDKDITSEIFKQPSVKAKSGHDLIEILNKIKLFDEEREEIRKITCKGMPDFEVQVLTRKNQRPKLKWYTTDTLCDIGEKALIRSTDNRELERERVK